MTKCAVQAQPISNVSLTGGEPASLAGAFHDDGVAIRPGTIVIGDTVIETTVGSTNTGVSSRA